MKRKPAAKGVPLKWLLDHKDHQGDECLMWPFGQMAGGYGIVTWNGSQMAASRAMCFAHHGEHEVGRREAAHSCGNRLCVNPNHLRWATCIENNADKVAHGTVNSGERNGQAKLTERDVAAIRAMYQTGRFFQRDIGKLFGVSDPHVCTIIKEKQWARTK